MSLYRSILNKIILKALPIQPAQAGLIQYDGNRFYLSEEGVVNRVISVASDVKTSDVVVENTTEKIEVNSVTIQPETRAGKYYRVKAWGKVSCANANDEFNIEFSVNGTLFSTAIIPGVVTNDPWYCTVSIILRTVGAGGTFAAGVEFRADNDLYDLTPKTGAIDTSVINVLTTKVQWSAARPGNSFTCMGAILEDMN